MELAIALLRYIEGLALLTVVGGVLGILAVIVLLEQWITRPRD